MKIDAGLRDRIFRSSWWKRLDENTPVRRADSSRLCRGGVRDPASVGRKTRADRLQGFHLSKRRRHQVGNRKREQYECLVVLLSEQQVPAIRGPRFRHVGGAWWRRREPHRWG